MEVEVAEALPAGENLQAARDDKAAEINGLVKNHAQAGIHLSKALWELRQMFEPSKVTPTGRLVIPKEWRSYIEEHVKLSDEYVAKAIRVWDAFGDIPERFLFNQPFEVLQRLAQLSIPEDMLEEAKKTMKAGHRMSVLGVKQAIKEMQAAERERLPTPTEAAKTARDTNTPTLARDGNLYFGATKEEAGVIEKRRKIVYGVRDAAKLIHELSSEMTPKDFLDYALPHQLWGIEDEEHIHTAADWFNELSEEWSRR